jgi:hypothetical protein
MRSKVATIVPVAHLELTKDDEYFMALSHVASASKVYVEFFKAMSDQGKYVILDNSAVEMGNPEPFIDYFAKAREMHASAIMLPDIFRDARATYMEAVSALAKIEDKELGDMHIIIIPQGKDTKEWMDNARGLYNLVNKKGIMPIVGISARYTGFFGGNRATGILLTTGVCPGARIHLLGCYADPRVEAWPLLGLQIVQSMDSSYPSVYAKHSLELDANNMVSRPSRDIDFIHDIYDSALLARNIKVWKAACEPQ